MEARDFSRVRVHKWAKADTLDALGASFAHYNREDIILALFHTGALFGKLAKEISKKQGYSYPEEAERYALSLLKEYWDTGGEK